MRYDHIYYAAAGAKDCLRKRTWNSTTSYHIKRYPLRLFLVNYVREQGLRFLTLPPTVHWEQKA